MLPTQKTAKTAPFFSCELCDFKCCKRSDYTKHLATDKHKKRQNPTYIGSNPTSIDQNNKTYKCNCGKIYKHSSTLYTHKKKCQNKINNTSSDEEKTTKIDNEPTEKELIMLLVKENSELKNMMMEVIKTGTHNTTHTNSHNKAFNLNFFLNETCKDAMNITDFVNSIQLQLSDLERVGKIGYVEGISNIITSNLKALDVTQRPIHCTDNKREVLYVKDEDKWEKEADEKEKIRKAIKNVANKNIRMLQSFKDIHPDCLKSESKYSDQYNKIVVESFGGQGDNDTEKENKIIKNISKGVTIEKWFDVRTSLSCFNILYNSDT